MVLKGEDQWTEKRDQVKVSIPLKGVAPSKVDIFGKNTTTPYIVYTLNCI